MENFDLDLARCQVKERAGGALADYIVYFRNNNIDRITDADNPFVIAYRELYQIENRYAGKCETEEDVQKLLDRIVELRAKVK